MLTLSPSAGEGGHGVAGRGAVGESRGIVDEVPLRLRAFAKGQRSSMPRAEALFWEQVRAGRLNGYKFKRQVPIAPYIVDFLCVSARLVVELDGQHHQASDRRERDADRDGWLRGQAFRVLRFSNEEVLGNCDLVLQTVLSAIEEPLDHSPAPLRGAPSPAKGERVGGADPLPFAARGWPRSSRKRE